jgi:hypothetical protein
MIDEYYSQPTENAPQEPCDVPVSRKEVLRLRAELDELEYKYNRLRRELSDVKAIVKHFLLN